MPVRRSDRRAIEWLVLVVTFAAITLYISTRSDELAPLLTFEPDQVLAVAGLVLVGVFLNALEFWLLYRRLGVEIGVVAHWLLFSAGQLLNHLPGQVGTLYRFQFLRMKCGLTYARTASGYAANLVLTILAASTLGLISVATIDAAMRSTWLALVFLGLLVLSFMASKARLPITQRSGFFGESWERFRMGWSDLAVSPSTTGWVLALETLRILLLALRMQLTMSWIGIEQSYSVFLAAAAVVGIVSFVALTPAALGIREIAIGITMAALGVSFDSALLGATLDRAVSVAVVGVVGGLGLVYTTRQLARDSRDLGR